MVLSQRRRVYSHFVLQVNLSLVFLLELLPSTLPPECRWTRMGLLSKGGSELGEGGNKLDFKQLIWLQFKQNYSFWIEWASFLPPV